MQRKSFGRMPCPIARSLEHVGEWWSILVLRDALHGLKRFDQFRKSLGIAPNVLARRLSCLVEAGLLERRCYSERPPRDEYVLTSRGRDFRPVLVALLAWGNKHFAPEGASVLLVNTKTGAAVEPVLVDPATGRPIEEPEYAFEKPECAFGEPECAFEESECTFGEPEGAFGEFRQGSGEFRHASGEFGCVVEGFHPGPKGGCHAAQDFPTALH